MSWEIGLEGDIMGMILVLNLIFGDGGAVRRGAGVGSGFETGVGNKIFLKVSRSK